MSEHNFQSLEEDVKTIKNAILGEGMHKNNGIIDRQQRTEKRLTTVERILWTAGGVILFVSFLAGIITISL